MTGVYILGLLFFSFLLIKAADLVIVAMRRLSRQTKTGVFALSAFILAIGTSLPELFVGLTSALEKEPSLALGVVLGSNIANISLVAGFSALIAGKVFMQGEILKKDVLIAFIASVTPIFLILDKTLGRVDGLILLTVYAAYTTSLFRSRYMEIAQEHEKESFIYRFLRHFNHINSHRTKELGRLFVGIAILLFSADMIVKISTAMAVSIGIPIFVIGLVILAFGTSLPEIAFSFESLEDHEPSMFFGNLLGSVIANSTLILGITAVITPIKIVSINIYLTAIIAGLLIFLVFWLFVRTKHRLDRWESLVLIVLYVGFVVLTFI